MITAVGSEASPPDPATTRVAAADVGLPEGGVVSAAGDPAAGTSTAMSTGERARTLRATAIGVTAVLMWSATPVLATYVADVPPFLLLTLAFSIAFSVVCARWLLQGGGIGRRFRYPPVAWAIGLGGLLGWHFCYFLAVRHAPVAEASLINHLWPLLIVLFSALLPGERLRWWHVAGAAAGLFGTVLLVTDGGTVTFKMRFATGYALALACAFIWSGYSVLNRRFARHVSTEAVGAFCGATAALAALGHLAFEATVWPEGWAWFAVLALGAGPLGAAFFTWDHGTKHGDIRVLGAASYLTPMLAAALLVGFGRAEASWSLLAACVLITGGATLAACDLLVPRSEQL
ncbi:MAG: EamA family transporter [Rhodospirillales bacterium]